jgi:hypothetical protein
MKGIVKGHGRDIVKVLDTPGTCCIARSIQCINTAICSFDLVSSSFRRDPIEVVAGAGYYLL